MKKIKYLLLSFLPLFILSSCSKEEIHVSKPKEIITKGISILGDDINTKETLIYDKKGNLTFKESFEYDDNLKSYIPDQKCEYTYDKHGNETTYIEYRYEVDSYYFYQQIFSYYLSGNLIKQEYYSLDDQNQVVLSSYFDDYKYDSLNRLTSYNEYCLNEETNKFVKSKETIYQYKDNFENYIRMDVKNLFNSFWDIYIIQELDDNGRVNYDIGGTLDGTYTEANFYVYNEDNELQSQSFYMVDSETGDYQLLSTEDYVYINNHYISEKYITYFDEGNVKTYQSEENTYDKKMNLIFHKEYELDSETKEMKLTLDKTLNY